MGLDSGIMRRIKEQQGKEGLNVSPLEPGTKLFVETVNSFYELVVIEGKEVTIFGGSRRDGSTRFTKPTKCIFHGSTWGGSMMKIDWIGEDMRMEFGFYGTRQILLTSSVQNVRIESPDGRWSYSMDWKTD